MTGRLCSLCCVLLLGVACSSSSSPSTPADAGTTTDAGATDAGSTSGCDDFSGAYIPTKNASCSFPGVAVPTGACVVQSGCNITVSTDASVLSGTVTGSTFTFGGDVMISGAMVHETCTGSRKNGLVDIECMLHASIGDATCSLPSEKQPLPAGASNICCAPGGTSCGSGQHCTYAGTGTQTDVLFPMCLPLNGSKMEGDMCTRSGGPGGMDPGYDDCGADLFCAKYGRLTSDGRACRKLCETATDCSASQACFWLGASAPAGGVCVSTCTPFGTDCSAGLTCRDRTVIDASGVPSTRGMVCDPTGTKAAGEACMFSVDCGPGLDCRSAPSTSGPICMALCDNAHPCTDANTMCSTIDVAGHPDLGVCAPK